MSDNFAQSYNGDDDGEVTKQAVHSRQPSVWMSHWMNSAICKSSTKQTQACGHLSNFYESREEEHREPKLQSLLDEKEKVSEDEKRMCEAAETRSGGIVDEGLIVKSDKLKSPFPMFNLQRRGDNALGRRIEQPSSSHWENLKSQTDHDSGYQLLSLGGGKKHLVGLPQMIQCVHDAKSPSRENPLMPECISEPREEERSAVDHKLAMGKSSMGDIVVSNSKMLPYGFNFGKTLARSIGKQEEINRSNTVLEPGEQVPDTIFPKNSMLLVCEDSVSKLFGRSRNPWGRHTDTDFLPRDPSTSKSHQPEFVAQDYNKVQDHGGMLFKRENHPTELSKSENLFHGNFSLRSLQHQSPGMDGTRACTSVDAVEESSRGCKKFSTTHHFLFTKTDFNLIEGCPMLKDPTKLKEKYSTELFPFDQDNARPVKTGVKLQLLGSSTGSEEEKDAKEFMATSVNMRNETSSETNTMDLDTFKRNYVSDPVSSSSNKKIELEQRSTMSQPASCPSRDDAGGKLQKANLPDINHPPNDVIAHANSADTSTSRTQSLDAEHLLSCAEQPENFKHNARPAGCLESEPSRWVKRLKLNSTSACGTQGSKIGEGSSYGKVNNMFSKILKFGVTGLNPITSRSRGKESMGFDQGSALWKGKTPSIDSTKKKREVTLSHPWIQRLCRNSVSTQEKSKAVVVAPQFSKASIEKRQKKQFPTLAAMALMGKTMGGMPSCQFTRKGSAVVWNS